MPLLKTNKTEVLIILSLLIMATLAYFTIETYNNLKEQENVYAEIVYTNKVIDKILLDEDRTFSVAELPNIIFEVKNREIAFISSDCPDKICVHTGWLGTGTYFAACLPNKVILRVIEPESGSGSEKIDAIAQ